MHGSSPQTSAAIASPEVFPDPASGCGGREGPGTGRGADATCGEPGGRAKLGPAGRCGGGGAEGGGGGGGAALGPGIVIAAWQVGQLI